MERKEKIIAILDSLVRIPSVTESVHESDAAFWIHDRLAELQYFKDHPENLMLVETPLEGAHNKLFSLVARVDASQKTDRTVLMVSHFDVVGVGVYGENEKHAFDPRALEKIYGSADGSGRVMWGRGVMDMKCGVALEIDILEEFAENRDLFDVNIVVTFVGDEENVSAGMRGVLPVLTDMQRGGTEFLAALNTEPGEAGCIGRSGPMAYTGTLGKLMPGFYIKGLEAHVGNDFCGFSSALAMAHIINYAEGRPDFADSLNGEFQPSWVCLNCGVMKGGYSVTLPDRAYAYFNCFTATNAPASVMEQMRETAERALKSAVEHHIRSYEGIRHDLSDEDKKIAERLRSSIKVFDLSEFIKLAEKVHGKELLTDEINQFIDGLKPGDVRDRGIAVVDKIARLSKIPGPYAVCFFLPPWMPVRVPDLGDERDVALLGVVDSIKEKLKKEHGLDLAVLQLFSGLCDLSYAGGKISEDDLHTYADNVPGWGRIYDIPLEEMQSLGLSVLNLGPSGEDAHRETERLYLDYSTDILPELLRDTIREISLKMPSSK
jgi:arginine utilization protein RocB